ncbi:2-dehydro-3-deoxy-6-phosphogalactonate aldolase [Aquamicrobium sp. LC103]|uniref:2-dehydro-3-deoxy-6-phosphogalactonate aldolase n=1 Tax=Aquamicrobium sp. LC103 TaxID=1120658 RepID=UPI00063E8C89|nr:2-dehydro-3-deoxy-6-phosphogalactonate aldolase [Aquamicrobium sp. LC103]TKT82416.1 2-dehydro-3-deoxy-6-phosphogalactonate aldolase [Aquamicrobium sp. LC103]
MSKTIAWPSFKRDLVAILRGVKPAEVEAIVGVLMEERFEAIEVPLNSPEPFRSIEIIAKAFGDDGLIGAGTVLSAQDCARVADAGGRLMVSPNVDPEVIAMAGARGMVSLPGVFTPTEALLALRSGASALKFFPASALGASGISAIKAILPGDTVLGAVGGVSETSFADFARIGVRTFGLGSSLYKPGDDAATVRARARLAVEAYDEAFAGAAQS